MDIACPNCAATYRVPDALIDGANALRCAACGHTWIPDPPARAEPEAVLPAPMLPEPLPEPPPPLPVPTPVAPPPPLPPVVSEPLPVAPAPEAAPKTAPEPPAAAVPPTTPPPRPAETTAILTPTRAGPPHLVRRRPPEGTPRQPGRGRALSTAWAVSIVLVAALVMGMVIYHAQIAEAWPPFGRLAG